MHDRVPAVEHVPGDPAPVGVTRRAVGSDLAAAVARRRCPGDRDCAGAGRGGDIGRSTRDGGRRRRRRDCGGGVHHACAARLGGPRTGVPRARVGERLRRGHEDGLDLVGRETGVLGGHQRRGQRHVRRGHRGAVVVVVAAAARPVRVADGVVVGARRALGAAVERAQDAHARRGDVDQRVLRRAVVRESRTLTARVDRGHREHTGTVGRREVDGVLAVVARRRDDDLVLAARVLDGLLEIRVADWIAVLPIGRAAERDVEDTDARAGRGTVGVRVDRHRPAVAVADRARAGGPVDAIDDVRHVATAMPQHAHRLDLDARRAAEHAKIVVGQRRDRARDVGAVPRGHVRPAVVGAARPVAGVARVRVAAVAVAGDIGIGALPVVGDQVVAGQALAGEVGVIEEEAGVDDRDHHARARGHGPGVDRVDAVAAALCRPHQAPHARRVGVVGRRSRCRCHPDVRFDRQHAGHSAQTVHDRRRVGALWQPVDLGPRRGLAHVLDCRSGRLAQPVGLCCDGGRATATRRRVTAARLRATPVDEHPRRGCKSWLQVRRRNCLRDCRRDGLRTCCAGGLCRDEGDEYHPNERRQKTM